MDLDFKTEKFKVSAEETEISGKYRYGKELADFVKDELSKVKCLGSDDSRYKDISIDVNDKEGWFLLIDDDFFKVKIYIGSSLFEAKMTEENIPEDINDLVWTLSPIVLVNLLDYRTYLNLLIRKPVYSMYYSQLSMDLEYIINKNGFRKYRILEQMNDWFDYWIFGIKKLVK